MALMLAGMLLFFGIHLVPWSVSLRDAMRGAMGPSRYRGTFALVSAVGLVLLVLGFRSMSREMLYVPPAGLRHLAMALMWVAFVLLPAAHMKGNLKRYTRHPMLWGFSAWATAHLLVRGELRTTLLFGSFLAYSLAAMASANARGATYATTTYPVSRDLMVVAAGTVAFVAFAFLHRYVIGIPVV